MQTVSTNRRRSHARHARHGAASLEYVLVLGAALPLAGACIYYGGMIVRLAYEMMCVLIAWPFM